MSTRSVSDRQKNTSAEDYNNLGGSTPVFRRFGEMLDADESRYLEAALTIYRNNRGCNTPVESFIVSQVLRHTRHPLDVEWIESEVSELKDNFEYTLSTAVRFAHQYPDQFRKTAGILRLAEVTVK